MVTYKLNKRLNRAQQKRRQSILAATREIISKRGGDDFNIHDVAKKAGVSRATLYRYYSDRDHLINDMALDWGLSLVERLRCTTPPGNTIGEKLTAVFTSLFAEAEQNPNLITVTLNSLISPDYALVASHVDVEQLLPSLIHMVIDEKETNDPDFVLGTLDRLTLANLLYINSGRSDLQEAVDNMARNARLLFGDAIWNQSIE